MATVQTKRYTVREGFVLVIVTTKADGSKTERRYDAGEEVTLSADQAEEHAHKIEFAEEKDRTAALKAEQAAAAQQAAKAMPADAMATFLAALQQMAAASAPAPAPAATA